MKNILGIVFFLGCAFAAFGMEVDNSLPAPKSLENQCISAILRNPRYFLSKDIEHQLLLDLHDLLHSDWYKELDKNPDRWWNKLVQSNNISQTIRGEILRIDFDQQENIVIMSRHTLTGAKLKLLDSNSTSELPSYTSQDYTDFLFDNELETYGINKKLWGAKHSKKRKLIIGIWPKQEGAFIYDYGPGEAFKEYILQAPLAHILLLEILRVAYNQGEKIALTSYEKEILNGMPPVFEKAKQFLMKTVQN